ncbi:MAG: Gfo/Idh/MocA family oxidoreductase [Verrucomicrobiales bacterium]|nr:Gfo/Idh/MocA family oxidoreductase [Verrucomicrobiales bacterium]
MMKPLNRREFVKQSMGAATALAALPHARAAGANERVVVGVMGLGGRGTALAGMFASRKDVEIAYLCDADTRRFGRTQAAIEQAQGRPVKCVQDFRRILDDPAVDVLVNATPDHWHGLGTILACQAGKHVYVEKPMAHNVWEGRKMVEAARKHNRVVTVGMQSRSAPYVQPAREIIRSGKLGDIRLVRVYNMMEHPFRESGPEGPVPAELDYNLWSGPARLLPYHAQRSWLNFAEYSCGPIPGDAVHQLDLARFLLGDPPPPKSVVHQGGIHVLRDGRDTPDSQYATYEYDDFVLLFQGTLWTPYMKKIPVETRNTDQFPDWEFCSTKIEILGTKDFMRVGRHGGGWQVLDGNDKVIAESYGRQGDADHIENFLQCVRSGNRPNADVEQGHQSVLLCHLANIAWQAGNPRLVFDAQTETFPDSPEANRLLKRPAYRAPWLVPGTV